MTPEEKDDPPKVTFVIKNSPMSAPSVSMPMCRSGRLRYARDESGVQRLQEEWLGGGGSKWTWVPGWEQDET